MSGLIANMVVSPLGRRVLSAFALITAVMAFALLLRRSGEQAGRAFEALERIEEEVRRREAARRRMNDADTSRGDPDGDARWLRERAASERG